MVCVPFTVKVGLFPSGNASKFAVCVRIGSPSGSSAPTLNRTGKAAFPETWAGAFTFGSLLTMKTTSPPSCERSAVRVTIEVVALVVDAARFKRMTGAAAAARGAVVSVAVTSTTGVATLAFTLLGELTAGCLNVCDGRAIRALGVGGSSPNTVGGGGPVARAHDLRHGLAQVAGWSMAEGDEVGALGAGAGVRTSPVRRRRDRRR
jgi:hypothetical protein